MPFRAFVVAAPPDPSGVVSLDQAALPPGDVLIDIEWSAVNYKDAMVSVPGNKVARISPLIAGVDLAGTVRESTDPEVAVGTSVVVHGYDLGVARHGGFAQQARVPGDWVVPLPAGLDTRTAMIIGTAGFTALLSMERLRSVGVEAGGGPVLVTGASGGVGSMTVALLAHHGYEVVASTGKTHERQYLVGLGASEVVGREDLGGDGSRVLGPERWAGAVDCVGGATLAQVLRTLRYGGAVAASGLTGGSGLETTVYPFIIRHVALLGVDTVNTPIEERRRYWEELATAFSDQVLASMVAKEITLDELSGTLAEVLSAKIRGRVLVEPSRTA